MITAYKGRKLVKGQKVKVYRNLHTGNFSIKCMATGLIVAHGDDFNITHANLVVNQKGRERVLKEKQKNVHAFVIGLYSDEVTPIDHTEAYYNPYKYNSFVDKADDQRRLISAKSIYFKDNKCFGEW